MRSLSVRGPLLRSLRLARGWTQEEAATKAGLTDRLIRKAESGAPLQLTSIAILAQLYSTPRAPLTYKRLLNEPSNGFRPDADEVTALVYHWFEEIWNRGRLDVIEELIAPKCVYCVEGKTLRGRAKIRRHIEAARAAFSDIDLRVERVLANGDWTAAHWSAAATQTGQWLGAPPAAERFMAGGSTWIRIEDGVFVEYRAFWQRQHAAAPRARKPRRRQ